MPAALVIREMCVEDATPLVSLTAELGYSMTTEEMRQNLQRLSQLPTYRGWVAEEEKRVIGYIATRLTHNIYRPVPFLQVIAIVINHAHRRQGIGRLLMQTAENFAYEQKCSHLELKSSMHRAKFGSHAFYESLDYQEINHSKKHFVKQIAKGGT